MSDAAQACPRCGRPTAYGFAQQQQQAHYQQNRPLYAQQPQPPRVVTTRRMGGIYELSGLFFCVLGVVSCAVTRSACNDIPGTLEGFAYQGGTWGGLGFLGLGLLVFMAGRFM